MQPEIRNELAPMQYRRFGRTDRHLSVITLGGMRYARGWERPRGELPQETIDNCRACVEAALGCGINHIETAWGYVKSEHVYGRVLNQELAIPRSRYHLMTKAAPKTSDETRQAVERQLAALQTDHIDLYAWHGLNDRACFDLALAKGGPVDTLLALRDEGVIGAVGFSTHAPLEVIIDAIETDRFDFVNLHYYYFNQRTRAAVERAASRDMGVFIISPNDKGGRLYDPPPLLRELTAPLTPIQWNARFCLSHPAVTTLSFGMTAADHFEEMLGTFPVSTPLTSEDMRVKEHMDARLGVDAHSDFEGWELADDPSGINIPEVLRLRRMWKCYDMTGFGRFRYNMFGTQGHWYPGRVCDDAALAELDVSRLPTTPDVRALLRETHEALFVSKEKT